MNCPVCEQKLEKSVLQNTEIDHCPTCLGLWFEKDELFHAKDMKEERLDWLDVDLWKDEKNFRVSEEKKHCPKCSLPLYEVNYGDSGTKVDVCNVCEGVWLDRGEFKKIMNYLREKGGEKIMNDYARTLLEEIGEVFVGPGTLKEEVGDVLTVLSLLKYRFAGKRPFLSKVISNLPKA